MVRRFFYDTEFAERPSTIELISIGIVNEMGDGIYCINSEFDESACNDWVKANVLPKLPPRTDPAWMTRYQIADALMGFLKPSKECPVELWGYYSAYDHVAMCWLFGSMIDLPEGMPMLTQDIKQLADSLGNPKLLPQPEGQHDALVDAQWNLQAWLSLTQESILLNEIRRLKAGLEMITQIIHGPSRWMRNIALAVLQGADCRKLEDVEKIGKV
jgi:hypothetical protein